MIAIVDYGVGNLFSLKSSLEALGVRCVVTGSRGVLDDASGVILPGVGAFGDAAAKLRESGLDEAVLRQAERQKPLLGICLGMQMLYESSFEYGEHRGLGLLEGSAVRLSPAAMGAPLKVPHMGWNSLERTKESSLLKYVDDGAFVYYVHSYFLPVSAATAALSRYGEVAVTGVAEKGLVFGTQFHPEKSGPVGLGILKAFCEMKG